MNTKVYNISHARKVYKNALSEIKHLENLGPDAIVYLEKLNKKINTIIQKVNEK